MEPKPGYKSSEFWLALAATLVGAVMASGILEETATAWDDKLLGMAAMVLASLGYTVSRTYVKSKAPE